MRSASTEARSPIAHSLPHALSPPQGAKVAVCELPFDYVSSDTKGGVGGTCVLRGCVPKKLMVRGGWGFGAGACLWEQAERGVGVGVGSSGSTTDEVCGGGGAFGSSLDGETGMLMGSSKWTVPEKRMVGEGVGGREVYMRADDKTKSARDSCECAVWLVGRVGGWVGRCGKEWGNGTHSIGCGYGAFV